MGVGGGEEYSIPFHPQQSKDPAEGPEVGPCGSLDPELGRERSCSGLNGRGG